MDDVAFLIIDDNSADAMIASILLKKTFGVLEVHTESTSYSAIDWIKTQRDDIDKKVVILLDMKMPDVDGFGFLEAYEKLDSTLTDNNIVFMLSSMHEGNELVQRAKNNPFVRTVLSKPLNLEELQELLESSGE